MPPATSRKPFHIVVFLWWCGDVFLMIADHCLLSSCAKMSKGHPGNHCHPTLWQPCLSTRPLFMDDVQWWISYREIQSLPFLGRHKALTSIHFRTCGTFWVDECPKFSRIVSSNAPGMVGNSTSDLMSGPRHEKTYWSGHPCQWGLHQKLNF